MAHPCACCITRRVPNKHAEEAPKRSTTEKYNGEVHRRTAPENRAAKCARAVLLPAALPEHLLHQRQLAIDIVGADAVAFEGHAQRVPQAKHH